MVISQKWEVWTWFWCQNWKMWSLQYTKNSFYLKCHLFPVLWESITDVNGYVWCRGAVGAKAFWEIKYLVSSWTIYFSHQLSAFEGRGSVSGNVLVVELYEGGSKGPCNHLFSLHMGAFIQRWQCLHQVWLHYGISIKTVHFGHC